MLDTINQICEQMTIDLRFVLCSNFLLMFIFKGSNLSKNAKKWISIGIMCFMAIFCWIFFDADGEKLFWSIPCASVGYDLLIKPVYKYLYNKYFSKKKNNYYEEQNNDIDDFDNVG